MGDLTLTAEQVAELNKKLSTMRHNINNNLALIVASVEVMKRKPERAAQMMENISLQPDRITNEMKTFSADFEKSLGIASPQ